MSSLVVRDLDPASWQRLRARAERSGRAPAAEAAEVLRAALASGAVPDDGTGGGLGRRVRRRFDSLGGLDLPHPDRGGDAPVRGS